MYENYTVKSFHEKCLLNYYHYLFNQRRYWKKLQFIVLIKSTAKKIDYQSLQILQKQILFNSFLRQFLKSITEVESLCSKTAGSKEDYL